ncbi:MAG TPA: TetR family transcriptional regulator, partial [Agromyces sp.]
MPMSRGASPETERRAPLTRARVLRTAVELVDEAGVASLTMRRLAEQVGVEPMSLYYHVPNKEAILDGIVDLVFREVE